MRNFLNKLMCLFKGHDTRGAYSTWKSFGRTTVRTVCKRCGKIIDFTYGGRAEERP